MLVFVRTIRKTLIDKINFIIFIVLVFYSLFIHLYRLKLIYSLFLLCIFNKFIKVNLAVSVCVYHVEECVDILFIEISNAGSLVFLELPT